MTINSNSGISYTLARISHKLSGNLCKMLREIHSQTLGEHCQIDKASAIEGEFAVTDCANSPRVCEKCGLDHYLTLSKAPWFKQMSYFQPFYLSHRDFQGCLF